ncbi:MAG TPA: hypothetical protein VNQ76_02335 [Planctomicrobium sp.]|nr:hypothetical protein [Planctomicrobium sp.]
MWLFSAAIVLTLSLQPNVLLSAEPTPEAVPPRNEPVSHSHLQMINSFRLSRTPVAVLNAIQTEVPAVGEKSASFEQQILRLKYAATLSDWNSVGEILAVMPPAEASLLYHRILVLLTGQMPPAAVQFIAASEGLINHQTMVKIVEQGTPSPSEKQPTLTLTELMTLVRCSPQRPIPQDHMDILAVLLNESLKGGELLGTFIEFACEDLDQPSPFFTHDSLASLFTKSGRGDVALTFLPSRSEMLASGNPDQLLLLAQQDLAAYRQHNQIESLEDAWSIETEAMVRSDLNAPVQAAFEAMFFEILPHMDSQKAEQWLRTALDSDTNILRQMVIRKAQSCLQSAGLPPAQRLVQLQQLHHLARHLVEVVPAQSQDWNPLFSVWAMVWIQEAENSAANDKSIKLPQVFRDPWGNVYYFAPEQVPQSSSSNPSGPPPILMSELLRLQPPESLLSRLAVEQTAKLLDVSTRMAIQIGDFPVAGSGLAELVKFQPERAHRRANDFLEKWALWHDGASGGGMKIPRVQQQPGQAPPHAIPSIPLTLSMQQRNLEDLTKWVRFLEQLPIDSPDQEQIVRAFIACHGPGEIYQEEAIEQVFGSIETLQPETVASLADQTRTRLTGAWRSSSHHLQHGSRRTQSDIEAELKRGYATILKFVDDALKNASEDWRLNLVHAKLLHDAAVYRRITGHHPTYTTERAEAFRKFEKAAQLYAHQYTLGKTEQSIDPYVDWFAASLGGCDLHLVPPDATPFGHQSERIREAILSLPEAAAERHLGQFARELSPRMQMIQPFIKYAYLHEGFQIVGNNLAAEDVRASYDYYSDLVKEVQLVSSLDGPNQTGHEEPFGVFIQIRHTDAMERVSDRFEKYLKSSHHHTAHGSQLSYPEKFEEVIHQAFGESFDVRSVTFQSPGHESRPTETPHWRMTPYAYVVLKAKGPEVDRIPPVTMTFDFQDKNGTISLPIQSESLLIDANVENAPLRPYQNLVVQQSLNERRLKDGVLTLEVSATAIGLIPPLHQLLDFEQSDFRVTSVEDRGLLVPQFNNHVSEVSVNAERQWQVTFQKQTSASNSVEFSFGKPKQQNIQVKNSRYQNGNLLPASTLIQLQFSAEHSATSITSQRRILLGIALALGGTVIAVGGFFMKKKRNKADAATLRIDFPPKLTPFTAIGFLRRLHDDSVSEAQRQELIADINQLEKRFFEEGESDMVVLQKTCQHWSKICQS